MRTRFAAVAALGLTIGLTACDDSGQEQAQTPREPAQQQQAAPPVEQQQQLTPAPPVGGPEHTPPNIDSQNSGAGATGTRTNE